MSISDQSVLHLARLVASALPAAEEFRRLSETANASPEARSAMGRMATAIEDLQKASEDLVVAASPVPPTTPEGEGT
jgi:hypothetical protein